MKLKTLVVLAGLTVVNCSHQSLLLTYYPMERAKARAALYAYLDKVPITEQELHVTVQQQYASTLQPLDDIMAVTAQLLKNEDILLSYETTPYQSSNEEKPIVSLMSENDFINEGIRLSKKNSSPAMLENLKAHIQGKKNLTGIAFQRDETILINDYGRSMEGTGKTIAHEILHLYGALDTDVFNDDPFEEFVITNGDTLYSIMGKGRESINKVGLTPRERAWIHDYLQGGVINDVFAKGKERPYERLKTFFK